MKGLKIAIPVILLALVVAGAGVQLYAYLKEPPQTKLTGPLLNEILPRQIPGWVAKDLDLGPTESINEQSMKILNLDDYVHREYRGPEGSFSVYVAYWGPGKMPIRLVSQHTPDRCWTENGWSCTDRKFNIEKTVDGEPIQPAQWGEYEIHEFRNQAYFWHVVDGEVKWYAGNRMNTRTTIKSVLLDVMNFTVNNKPDQYFVRIVSQQSLDELWELPGFQDVMQVLAELCLAYPEEAQEA